MTISEMLGQSGLLTLLGMTVVFSFIIILIICMKLLQLAVRVFKLDKNKGAETKSSSVSQNSFAPSAQSASDDTEIVAAIAAALHDKQLNL